MAKTVSARKNGNNVSVSYDELKEIEKLAYQFFVERGFQDGHDQEDWFRAQSIVKSRRS